MATFEYQTDDKDDDDHNDIFHEEFFKSVKMKHFLWGFYVTGG